MPVRIGRVRGVGEGRGEQGREGGRKGGREGERERGTLEGLQIETGWEEANLARDCVV
jgi:hypothetical protein